MERFLLSAALVVFLTGGAIKDVFEVLQIPTKRQRFIDKIPAKQRERMEEYVATLNELDDVKKDSVTNKTDKVSGILDRLNKLKINTYTELMLKKDGSDNINLVDEIQKNQLICLRMPDSMLFLLSAALVVFLTGGAIKDVFEVLQIPAKRQRFIDKIPAKQRERMEEYVATLNELDDVKKDSVTNKTDKVSGILDRLNKLKINTYTELMLKKDGKDNINLVDEIQKNQLICLRMPDSMFATDQERDIYCLYWLSKIWLAVQIRKWQVDRKNHVKVNVVIDELDSMFATDQERDIYCLYWLSKIWLAVQIRKWQVDRKNHVKVNVVIDELYQVNNTEAFLTEKLSRLTNQKMAS